MEIDDTRGKAIEIGSYIRYAGTGTIGKVIDFRGDNESYNENKFVHLEKPNLWYSADLVEVLDENDLDNFKKHNRREKQSDNVNDINDINNSSKDFEDISSVLDKEIIKMFQETLEKPKQYEIYMKYHPNITENSAKVSSSTNLINFLHDLKEYLLTNNPEIFQ